MTASHGRAGRRGGPWWTTALAASGLFLAVSGGRPVRACHIHHETAPAHASATTPTPASSTTPTPSQAFQQALQKFLKDWHDNTTAAPQVLAPIPAGTPTSGMTQAAAQILTPPTVATPTVQNSHQAMPATCTPPPPPPCTGGTPTTSQGQTLTPPSTASSGLQNPTPAPEPSTILSAIALVGAVAWRRRSLRARSSD